MFGHARGTSLKNNKKVYIKQCSPSLKATVAHRYIDFYFLLTNEYLGENILQDVRYHSQGKCFFTRPKGNASVQHNISISKGFGSNPWKCASVLSQLRRRNTAKNNVHIIIDRERKANCSRVYHTLVLQYNGQQQPIETLYRKSTEKSK